MGFGLGLFWPPILVGAVVVAISAIARSPLAVSGSFPAVAKVHHRLVTSRIVGFILALACGIAYIWILVSASPGGRNDLLVVVGGPVVFSLAYLLCLLLSEYSAYRPATTLRTAGLGSRSAADYFPRRSVILISLATAFVAAALAVQYYTVNAGTAVRVTCTFDGDLSGSGGVSSAGFTMSATDRTSTVAMAASLVVAATLALSVALTAARRARPDADLIAASEDDALRRNSVKVASGIFAALVAIVGTMTSIPLAVVLRDDFYPCVVPRWWSPYGTVLMCSLPAWLFLFGWSVAQICARPTSTRKTATIG